MYLLFVLFLANGGEGVYTGKPGASEPIEFKTKAACEKVLAEQKIELAAMIDPSEFKLECRKVD